MVADISELEKLAKLVRYYILRMTTRAGSGHPTSSLSATDLMVALFFGHLRFDVKNPENPNNDRVIFSKGHASPLLYALWGVAGVLSERELDTYRQFKSVLEGHPNPRFKYVDVATGSLGQGLSIGLGMAIALRAQSQKSLLRSKTLSNYVKSQNLPRVYVLMGDSETAEGSVWEAIELASYYNVGNLVGIIDVNRLGQSRPTILGWDTDSYKKRVESFGWGAKVIDGHDFGEIIRAYGWAQKNDSLPKMIIAKTIKGRGVSFLEDKEGWHGKALDEEQFKEAVAELGDVDLLVRGEIKSPGRQSLVISHQSLGKKGLKKTGGWKLKTTYKLGEEVATRKAYGEALAKLGEIDPRIVALDGEVSNSTFSEIFRERFPKRYFEMFIAEQNMVGVALGMSKRGYIPFVSTFAAFFTRAYDQIRMSAYSRPNVKFVGSHAGVSIGEDGPSQMGLEDFALFRSVFGSVVMCPADAVACFSLVALAALNEGIFYIRTNRPATPVIYNMKGSEQFKIGGSKVVRGTKSDQLTIVACGVTLTGAIKAADELSREGVNVRVVDAYSIKPIDEDGIRKAAAETNNLVVTVEDHFPEGGLGDAVLSVFASEVQVRVFKLAVFKMPMSGKREELFSYEGISADAITSKVKEILG